MAYTTLGIAHHQGSEEGAYTGRFKGGAKKALVHMSYDVFLVLRALSLKQPEKRVARISETCVWEHLPEPFQNAFVELLGAKFRKCFGSSGEKSPPDWSAAGHYRRSDKSPWNMPCDEDYIFAGSVLTEALLGAQDAASGVTSSGAAASVATEAPGAAASGVSASWAIEADAAALKAYAYKRAVGGASASGTTAADAAVKAHAYKRVASGASVSGATDADAAVKAYAYKRAKKLPCGPTSVYYGHL